MILIPAIDLKDGKCVRLTMGRAEDSKIYSDDPASVAAQFARAGAPRLHVIDLDAAFGDPARNAPALKSIRERVTIPIQIGGGVRTACRASQLLADGFDYVIIGTMLVTNPSETEVLAGKNPGKIIAACDVSGGRVAINGWRERSGFSVEDVLAVAGKRGISQALVTDIGKDGMLSGVDLKFYDRLASAARVGIIVSGGVSALDDIKALAALKNPNIVGVVIGKALYEGRFAFAEALACLRSE